MSATPARIGRYEILHPIYGGGMASVFKAHDPQIDRDVCIKQVRDELDAPDLRELFLREVRAAGKLRHPNIIDIYDTGEFDGRPFIVMEFIPGKTLAALIEARTALTLADRLRLMEQLCDGLACAHRAGIVHRDIKPANVIVDESGTLKILDFGIARLSESGPVSRVIGTINYMSPEQWAGGQLDRRSDIFSAGAVCYELLSHQQAFPGMTAPEVYARIMSGPPRPLATLCPDVDPKITSMITRMLDASLDVRPLWLEQVRDEFQQLRLAMPSASEMMFAPTVRLEQPIAVGLPTLPSSARAAATIVNTPAGNRADASEREPRPAIDSPTIVQGQTVKVPTNTAAGTARPRSLNWAWGAVGALAVLVGAYGARAYYQSGTTPPVRTGVASEAPPTSAPAVVPPRQAIEAPVTGAAATTSGRDAGLSTGGEPAASNVPRADTPRRDAAPPISSTGGTATVEPRRSASDAARCTELLEKLSLGEGLTKAENDFRIEKCHN